MTYFKELLLLTGCLFLVSMLTAQDITWMPKNKLAKKDETRGWKILGVDNGEIAIKTRERFAIVDLNTLEVKEDYKSKMSFHPSHFINGKWVSFRDDAKLFKMNKPYCIFYKDHRDESSKETKLFCNDLYADKSKRKQMKEELKKNGVPFNYLISSPINKWFVYPLTNYIDKTIEHKVYNENLELVYEKEIKYTQRINDKKLNLNYSRLIINDNGDLRYIGYNGRSTKKPFIANLLTYDHASDKIESFISKPTKNIVFDRAEKAITSGKPGRKEESVKYHFRNEQAVYAGIYKDQKGERDLGIFVGKFDIADGSFTDFQEVPFSEEILAKIKGDGKKIKGQILISELLVKDNGDVTLLLELEKNKSGMQMNFNPNGNTENYFQVNVDKKDIIYYNFNSENELTYSGVIKKNQNKDPISASSFFATTIDNITYIIFNSLDRKNSSILRYSISEDGSSIEEEEISGPSNKYILPTKNFVKKDTKEIILKGLDGQKPTLVKIQL